MRFKNKIAFVTGAGSGIGRSIAFQLAADGAFVIVSDIEQEQGEETARLIRNKEGQAIFLHLDVADNQQINTVIAYVYEHYGYINYWINNAGVSYICPFSEQDENLWDRTMTINLKSQYLCCKAIIPYMLENGEGSILNMSSEAGKVGSDSYQAYCASKFGVVGLTQSLAKEYGPLGIRINAICPGIIHTPMWDRQQKDYARKRELDPSNVMDYLKSRIPLRRLGKSEDVANLAVFLLSDEASFITGQAININGGDYMQ